MPLPPRRFRFDFHWTLEKTRTGRFAKKLMANIPVTRAELSEKVLAAIRQEPGCEGVKEVSISAVSIVGGQTTWRATALDYGSADFNAAFNAASRITEMYTRLFQLVD